MEWNERKKECRKDGISTPAVMQDHLWHVWVRWVSRHAWMIWLLQELRTCQLVCQFVQGEWWFVHMQACAVSRVFGIRWKILVQCTMCVSLVTTRHISDVLEIIVLLQHWLSGRMDGFYDKKLLIAYAGRYFQYFVWNDRKGLVTLYNVCRFGDSQTFFRCATVHRVSMDAPEDWKGRGTWRLIDVSGVVLRMLLGMKWKAWLYSIIWTSLVTID